MAFFKSKSGDPNALNPNRAPLARFAPNELQAESVMSKVQSFGRALSDPGNSRKDALTIKKFPYENEGRVGSDKGGSDFYKIKQTKDKKIKFTIYVENDEGIFGPNLTFALQNKNGKTLAKDKVSGTDDDEIVKKLGKGTYFIKVSTDDGESVPYDVEVRKG